MHRARPVEDAALPGACAPGNPTMNDGTGARMTLFRDAFCLACRCRPEK